MWVFSYLPPDFRFFQHCVCEQNWREFASKTVANCGLASKTVAIASKTVAIASKTVAIANKTATTANGCRELSYMYIWRGSAVQVAASQCFGVGV